LNHATCQSVSKKHLALPVPTVFFTKTIMKTQNIFSASQKCVKISRFVREAHAAAKKLFTTRLKRQALRD
jgi:hypothetical protein